jgi:hypothetical protein
MAAPNPAYRPWPRIIPCMVVLAAAASVLFVAGLATYQVGARNRRLLPEDRPPNNYEAHLVLAMNYALKSSEYNDVVFIGDSTALTGIRTLDFQRETGLRAYNLSSMGVIGVDGCTIILRAYLSHHPKPRLLVFGVCPWSLGVKLEETGPIAVRRAFLYCYAPRGESDKLVAGSTDERIKWVMGRGAHTILGKLQGGAEHFANDTIPLRDGLTYNWLDKYMSEHRGYYPNPGALPSGWRRPPPDPSDMNACPVGRVLPGFETAFSELAGLARKEGIPLLVRLTPVSPPSVEENYQQIRSWSASVEGQGVYVSQPDVLIYDSPLFCERLHCNDDGAKVFTAFVAREAKRVLGMH